MKLDTPQPSDFDPYYRWLGIPKGQRPPNHYRLLGISPKEDDPEIIEAAIERQTNAVKAQKQAQHEKIAARILYEIQEAGVVILDRNRRKEYDAALARPRTRAKRSSVASGLPPYSPYKPAGEQNEIVRTYFGVMSVILGGFVIMAVVSFMLPWRKVVFGIQDKKVLVETEEAEAEQETVRQPIVAPRPVAKIMGGSHGEITNSTGMKRVLVSAGSEKSSDAQALPTTESQRAFEESLPGKYRLELVNVENGKSENGTVELQADKTFTASDGHKGTWETSGTQLIVKNSDQDIESGPATREKDGVLTGTLTNKSNGNRFRSRLTKMESLPSGPVTQAQWVLERGGSLTIAVDGRERSISPGNELPTGAFDVVGVNLKGRRDISDGDLDNVSQFSALRSLNLMETGVTNDGLSHVEGLTNLEIVNLAATSISDDGLAHLSGLQRLQELYFGGCPIHGEGLVHLKSLPQLRLLGLIDTKMTDAGLAHLQDIQTLTELRLQGDRVTDGGIKYLVKMHQLRKLGLTNTKISASGMKRLRRVLRQCQIEGRK